MLSPPHKTYRLFFKQSNARSQHTTKVGPEVFVVSHSEVLKSREGCCVTAMQVGYMTQGAPPKDTNTYCYMWADILGTSGVQLQLCFSLCSNKKTNCIKCLLEVSRSLKSWALAHVAYLGWITGTLKRWKNGRLPQLIATGLHTW